MAHPPAHRNGAHPRLNETPPARDEVGGASTPLDELEAELRRLAAAHEELVGQLSVEEEPPAAEENEAMAEEDELILLRAENLNLRAKVEELEQLLQVAEPGDNHWAERQREYETLLEEKSEVIRTLHMKLQDLQESLQEQRQAGPAEPTISAADLPEAQDLMRQKQELEEQRRQLQEDEEALMAQNRQMELALSRDRAELARQRNELLRLQADLNREIEQASRDPQLQERLKNLRRPSDSPKKETPADAPAVPADEIPTKPMDKSSGFFRRIFG